MAVSKLMTEKKMNQKFRLLMLVLILILVACGGSSESTETDNNQGQSEVQMDPETGLEINPNPIPTSGQFIVEGIMVSNTLVPQDSPEFTVQSPAGKNYRMLSQPLSAITYEDGSAVDAPAFVRGLPMRATVSVGSNNQTSTLTTTNLVVLQQAP